MSNRRIAAFDSQIIHTNILNFRLKQLIIDRAQISRANFV
jgi:hypothetical protein